MGKIRESLEKISKEENFEAFHNGLSEFFHHERGGGAPLTTLKVSTEDFFKHLEKARGGIIGYGETKDYANEMKKSQEELKQALHWLNVMKEAIRDLQDEKIKFHE